MIDKPKTISIIDTSVLLDDCDAIYNIPDSRLIIPYVVLEELDKKKNDTELGKNARRAIQNFDRLNGSIHSGADLGNGSTLEIAICDSRSKQNDQKIIDFAYGLNDENVKIITQDVCMRVKAAGMNIEAEAYGRERIKEKQIEEAKSQVYSGVGDIDLSEEEMSIFYSDGFVEITDFFNDRFDTENEVYPNQFLRIKDAFKGDNSDGIGIIKKNEDGYMLKRIFDYRSLKKRAIKPKNIEQNLLMNLCLDPSIICVTTLGVAGTGKTLMLLDAAIDLYLKREVKNVYLTKPQMAIDRSEEQGFYPGDGDQKFAHWTGSFFCNLKLVMDKDSVDDYIQKGVILPIAATTTRGESWPNAVVVVDELQNWNKKIAKTIMTRVGENTKIFCSADIDQIDSPYLDYLDNGAVHCVESLKRSPLVGHVTLHRGERSPFAALAADVL